VILLNDLIDSLLERNPARARECLQLLRAEAPGHPALHALQNLYTALEQWPVATTDASGTAKVVQWLDSEVAHAATNVLGTSAPTFMSSLWRELAVAVASQAYDPAYPQAHSALVRAGMPAALQAVTTIPGRDLDLFVVQWRRWRATAHQAGRRAVRPLRFGTHCTSISASGPGGPRRYGLARRLAAFLTGLHLA